MVKPYVTIAEYTDVVHSIEAFSRHIDCFLMLELRLDAYTDVFKSNGIQMAEMLISGFLLQLESAIPPQNRVFRVSEKTVIILIGLPIANTSARARELVQVCVGLFEYKHQTPSYSFLEIIPGARVECSEMLEKLRFGLVPEWKYVLDASNGTLKSEVFIPTFEEVTRAFKLKEITSYYQPIVDGNKRLKGVELLSRWEHPEFDLLNPDKYIDAVNKYGFSFNLFNTNLKNALSVYQSFEGGVEFFFSINMEPQLLNDMRVINAVTEVVAKYPTLKLELEIVEQDSLTEVRDIANIILKLKGLGVRIVLDDFGQKYAWVNSLESNFDKVKLDRSIVDKASKGNVLCLQMVKALCEQCKNSSKIVLAEGIDALSKFEEMKELGVEQFQGFGLAMPMDKQALLKWVPTNSERHSHATHTAEIIKLTQR
ncbi:TPA: EAL domain-containing protein [Vibrio vulnificus]|nr:EAL domain-containing protein [Vibrio vulnificus]